ncbi:glycosyltransferase family 4 protein, partial [bacterium]|nr:glycosyltransferase family 4 protein [bacterium]
ATQWNVDVFRDSGITIPIGCVPHCISENDGDNIQPFNIASIPKDTYVFGFVSQWTERKDPLSLLKAYWYAFQNNENVALVMKTYRSSYAESEKDAIRSTIKRLKSIMVFDSFPKLYYISDMLTEDEMRGLYKRMDCYVTLDRGEGWGLGPFQAGAYGKPVIATGFGGVTEFLKDDNSYLVDYTLSPTHGMPFSPWYRSEQLWAQADVAHGAQLMQEVFNNQEAAKETGTRLQTYIHEYFSHEVVGARMLKEIEEAL